MGGTLRREKKLAEVVLGEKREAGETPFRDFLPISFVNIRQFSVVVGLVRTPFVRCVCCVGWLCVCECSFILSLCIIIILIFFQPRVANFIILTFPRAYILLKPLLVCSSV